MARFSDRVRMMYTLKPEKAMQGIIGDNFLINEGKPTKLYQGDKELERLQYDYVANNKPDLYANLATYINNLEEYMFKYIGIAIEDDLKENPIDEKIKEDILKQMNEKNN